MVRLSTLLFALALCAAPAFLCAQSATQPDASSHFPTNEDLRHIKAVSAPLLSPQGTQVLFTVTRATADGAVSNLWIVPVAPAAGEKARQLTSSPPADKRGEHNAQWAPDGSAVFFLAKRGEHTQLFRLDLRGGEASPYDLKILPPIDESKEKDAINPPPPPPDSKAKKPEDTKLEPLPLDIAGFAISEDGKYLALWAHDPETPGEKKQKEAKIDASWVNRDKHVTRLYLASIRSDGTIDGNLKPVAIPPDIHGAVWSPEADKLLVVIEPPNDLSDLGPAGSAYVVDAAAPDVPTKLESMPATIQGGAWTLDGNSIVFSAQTPEDAPPGYEELFAFSPSAAGSNPVRLSAGFPGQLSGAGLYPQPDRALVTIAAVGTRMTPVRLSLDGKSAPTLIDFGDPFTSALNTNRKQTGWVWIASGGGQPNRLCYARRIGDPCTALPIPELAPANLRSVAPQLISWKSGAYKIEGLLFLPPNTVSGKVPLIVDVHGGPLGAWENRADPFADFLVGHGWAILRPNPRGSSNYGVRFAAANKNDLGGGDYQDVMAGLDYVISKYPIDSSKLALIGYSYGGEMAGFAEGKTDRFKAIVSGAPVIDQLSEYGTEKGSWYDRWYFGKPWQRMQDAWRQSPLSGALHAKTPFLLLQGQSDTTDPLGQSEEMYRALRQEGIPVELVTYPREDHGPLVMGIFGHPTPEPWHGFDARQRIVKFIQDAFSGNAPAKP